MKDAFILTSTGFSDKETARNETLFTVANGTFGLRGDYEEKSGTFHKGTYINGFYDTEPIVYGESAFGYAQNHQTILNLPDPKSIELTVNKIPFSVTTCTIQNFSQSLDFKTGVMTRSFIWVLPDSTEVEVQTKRIVCFSHESIAAISYKVSVLKGSAHIRLESAIDFSACNVSAKDDPRVGSKFSSAPLIIEKKAVAASPTTDESEKTANTPNSAVSLLEYIGIPSNDRVLRGELAFCARTRNSNLRLAGSVVHRFVLQDERCCQCESSTEDSCVYSALLSRGKTLRLEKYISYDTGSDAVIKHSLVHSRAAAVTGFTALCSEQSRYLSEFWENATFGIEGDKESERAIHFNLFQLLQSAGQNGRTSMSAKGLTAEGYEGHYFWDTEAYACPVFTYIKPETAARLLSFRFNTLQAAKERATCMSLQGALFPWRTINGEEASAYFPAGTAQYHIDADIMLALWRFLLNAGGGTLPLTTPECLPPKQIVSMAVETARMWLSLGSFIPEKGNAFCINEVTGPDEYTACVNNNAYTNLMAQKNLRISATLAAFYGASDISLEEIKLWLRVANAMYVPYNAASGIYPQDDSFMAKAAWNFDSTPQEHYPLLLHYHPLVIYRRRVLKQPDFVLAQFLLSSQFTLAEKIRNFNFYEKYTTGDSSLSHCIQSIMACETLNVPKAWDYFCRTARMDIEDIHNNTKDGIHTACMAGSWLAAVYGFAGFRDYDGNYSFNPQLPDKWKKLTFSLQFGKKILTLHCTHDFVEYRFSGKKSGTIHFKHRNTEVLLETGEIHRYELRPKLKAVLFDLDGVITNTAEMHYKAWKIISEKYNLAFNRSLNERLRGISREDSFDVILRSNNCVWEENRKKQIIQEKNDIYLSLLYTITPKDILPGIETLLHNLKAHGIYIVLASSSRNAPFVCRKLGITSLLDYIIDPASVKMLKPEPDIFLKGAELAGVWHTDCIGIEDAQAGINAINAAGMCSCGIGSALRGAHRTFESTSALSFSALQETFDAYATRHTGGSA